MHQFLHFLAIIALLGGMLSLIGCWHSTTSIGANRQPATPAFPLLYSEN